jgi:hypothetical protein
MDVIYLGNYVVRNRKSVNPGSSATTDSDYEKTI